MSATILRSKHSVILVGGGHVSSPLLETLRTRMRTLVAADGGARHGLKIGWTPDAVIGDMDSLNAAQRALIPEDRLHRIPEQDSTDFEKCLLRIDAPLVVGLGFMGPRTDHQLATFHGLMRCADRPCILVGDHQIVFLCPPEISLQLAQDDLVSLFPMGRVAARSDGLRWPLEGVDLEPGRMVGTSNRAVAPTITVSCDQPKLLFILPGQALDAAMEAVQGTPSRWPVPAE